MFSLGWLYSQGTDLQPDYPQAVYWYEKAADAGIDAAMNNLGELYAQGLGVERDLDKAMELYRRASERGNAMAYYNMGWYMEQAG